MAISATGISLKEGMNLLKDCYQNATRKNGLIAFTRQIRTPKKDLSGKYSLKQAQLDSLFSRTVWSVLPTGNGHRKLKNIVTNVVINYGNHDKDIDAGAVDSLLKAVQEHLNLLRNDVFKEVWKKEPDYQSSAKRWLKL